MRTPLDRVQRRLRFATGTTRAAALTTIRESVGTPTIVGRILFANFVQAALPTSLSAVMK
jgi:hypothetical protein